MSKRDKPKANAEKPISLHPLRFEQAVDKLLSVQGKDHPEKLPKKRDKRT